MLVAAQQYWFAPHVAVPHWQLLTVPLQLVKEHAGGTTPQLASLVHVLVWQFSLLTLHAPSWQLSWQVLVPLRVEVFVVHAPLTHSFQLHDTLHVPSLRLTPQPLLALHVGVQQPDAVHELVVTLHVQSAQLPAPSHFLPQVAG